MKTLIISCLAVILFFAVEVYAGDVYVNGHWKDTNHDGVKDTYVEPYHRTTPNSTTTDNYGTYPNVNPYTGQQGTVKSNSNPYDYSGGHKTKSRY